MKKQTEKFKSVIEMSAKEARSFFLEHKTFSRIDLPDYFNFSSLVNNVAKTLGNKKLEDIMSKRISPSEIKGVNHVLLTNKDGKYAWRQMEIIHPVLYAHLVREITKEESWENIIDRFSYFRDDCNLRCLSIPKKSFTGKSSEAENVSHWWEHVEQRSIELALQYEWMATTDIADCFESIYTHSIAWALHGMEEAKQKRKPKELLGNVIDQSIRYMRNGQTNGIPPGSVLLDFVVEMVLGYADSELLKRIKKSNIKAKEYKILRYVDDYRIFVKKKQDGAIILKLLSETLFDLGLSLSSAKTNFSEEIIRDSIKPDKLVWEREITPNTNLQKALLIIHGHAKNYPNSGSVVKALGALLKKEPVSKKKNPYLQPKALISIIVDIALHNPKAQRACFALLGRILKYQITQGREKTSIVSDIQHKFSLMPNVGHMEIWLQRITLPESIDNKDDYAEALCKVAKAVKRGGILNSVLWNNGWIKDKALKKAIDEQQIIDAEKLESADGDIPYQEVVLFSNNQY